MASSPAQRGRIEEGAFFRARRGPPPPALPRYAGEGAPRPPLYGCGRVNAALVALDLAVLLSEQGRTQELKVLAVDLLAAFESREIHRERDVKTTMIYTHVLNRGGRGIQSPADTL